VRERREEGLLIPSRLIERRIIGKGYRQNAQKLVVLVEELFNSYSR
jgi:hypothetical protein